MNVWTLLAAITFAEPVIKHAVLVLHSGGSIVLAILGCRRRKFTSVDGTTTKRHTVEPRYLDSSVARSPHTGSVLNDFHSKEYDISPANTVTLLFRNTVINPVQNCQIPPTGQSRLSSHNRLHSRLAKRPFVHQNRCQ